MLEMNKRNIMVYYLYCIVVLSEKEISFELDCSLLN